VVVQQVPQKPSFWTRTRVLITVIGTLVAIVGGSLTIYFTLHDRPKPRTVAQWSTEANAVCDIMRGELNTKFLAGLNRMNADSEGQGDPQATAMNLVETENLYKAWVGRLQTLKLPDTRADEVQQVFRDADQLERLLSRGSLLISQVDPRVPDAEPLRSQVVQNVSEMSAAGSRLTDDLRRLGAIKCIE